MAVTVTTTIAGGQQVNGTQWNIDQGYLTVADDNGNSVASYAPGIWQSVEQVTPS